MAWIPDHPAFPFLKAGFLHLHSGGGVNFCRYTCKFSSRTIMRSSSFRRKDKALLLPTGVVGVVVQLLRFGNARSSVPDARTRQLFPRIPIFAPHQPDPDQGSWYTDLLPSYRRRHAASFYWRFFSLQGFYTSSWLPCGQGLALHLGWPYIVRRTVASSVPSFMPVGSRFPLFWYIVTLHDPCIKRRGHFVPFFYIGWWPGGSDQYMPIQFLVSSSVGSLLFHSWWNF